MVVMMDPVTILLIQLCLLHTTACYDKVFWGSLDLVNGILSEQHDQLVGVPQGSPLSPVLSITYTSSLLHKMAQWNNSSLGMYVDDSILFACSPDWEGVETVLHARYTVCKDWLQRHLLLPDREGNTYYSVMLAETLRYLGFFFQSDRSGSITP